MKIQSLLLHPLQAEAVNKKEVVAFLVQLMGKKSMVVNLFQIHILNLPQSSAI